MLVVLYLLIGSVKNWIDVFNSIPEMMWTAIFVALAAGLEKNFYVESYYLIYLLKSLKVKIRFSLGHISFFVGSDFVDFWYSNNYFFKFYLCI